MRVATCLLVLTALLAPDAHSQGDVIVVVVVPDFADFPAPRTVAELPGPDGRVTLREAVIAANNTLGSQIIHFNVPMSRWDPLYSDRVLIFSDITPFVITDDSLTIDGTSQTAFTGDTNPDGSEVAFWGEHPNALGSPMFSVYSDHNTFIGLGVVHRRGYGLAFRDEAEHNRVLGCVMSGPLYAAVEIEGSHNVVGGTGQDDGNRLSSGNDGVRIQSDGDGQDATGNRIIGNDLLTGDVSGVQIRGGAVGTVVGGPTEAERNVIAGAGRYGEQGFPVGDQVRVYDSFGTVIEGNYIGTTAEGLGAAQQIGPNGVEIRDASGTVVRGNVIGGILVEGRNHHQGNFFGAAIDVTGVSVGTVIEGNLIGVGADGQTPIPNLYGVRGLYWSDSGTPTNTIIGGTDPEDGNTIAYNERVGIGAEPSTEAFAVLGNAVFENGGLDLGFDGPTPNDAADLDEGTNRLQNHPVIESAKLSGTTLTVTYSVDTAPANATYPLRAEFFKADADSEEGMRFLGADTYTETDYQNGQPGTKTVELDVTAGGLAESDFVLGTATDEAGNTSEFGAAVGVSKGTITANEPASLPGGYALSAVYPNPFNPQARFSLEVTEAQQVTVAVFDALGRRVGVLHDGLLSAGTAHTLTLDGAGLPSGLYVVRATGETFTAGRMATLLK